MKRPNDEELIFCTGMLMGLKMKYPKLVQEINSIMKCLHLDEIEKDYLSGSLGKEKPEAENLK